MNNAPSALKSAILGRIHADAPRKVWTPGDFIDLASRDAIDKALQRLTKADVLRRIDLGLTNAVPAKIVVHTDARCSAIKLGDMTITFRPTVASKLFWAGRPAMRLVQALHWLRDLLGREGESDQIRRKLARLFDDPKAGPPLKADLIAGMAALPTWMWVSLKPLVEGGSNRPDVTAQTKQKSGFMTLRAVEGRGSEGVSGADRRERGARR